MYPSAFFAFLHFVAAFGLVSTVILERVLFKPKLNVHEVKRLGRIDSLYGLSALVVLVVGFIRVFYFEKGSSFYFANPLFHIKLTVFILIGLLSIYPTVKIIKWGKTKEDVQIDQPVYKKIIRVLNIELGLLVLLLLSASMMAKGVFF